MINDNMTEQQIPIDEPLPSAGEILQLLIRTTHQLHCQFEMLLAASDLPVQLTGPRLRFLIAVSEAGQVRMSDLAAIIGIQARTVTQFVDALEQENLLVRLPDPDDRRATRLQLTESAQPVIVKARAAMGEFAEQVLAHLPLTQRIQFADMLYRLTDRKIAPSCCE